MAPMETLSPVIVSGPGVSTRSGDALADAFGDRAEVVVVLVASGEKDHEFVALARQLEQAGQIDPKTGLLNAAAWNARAQHALHHRHPDHAVPRAVLIINLDRFKTVNDTHDHLAGDTVLTAVADTLRAEVRDHDIVGRFGDRLGDRTDVPTASLARIFLGFLLRDLLQRADLAARADVPTTGVIR